MNTEKWAAWLDGQKEEAVEFEVPVFGISDIAALGAAALGVDLSELVNVERMGD